MKLFLGVVFVLVSCGLNTSNLGHESQSSSQIAWHWEDDFSVKEQEKLTKYLTEVTEATYKVLGEYPFKVHYFLHRSDSDKEPIPWAHTERGDVESVHFYVCADFPLSDFRTDWTAPHEISHLSIPFLGAANAWFSEGYATYMQLQIMKEMGVYTFKEMEARYAMKDELVKGAFSQSKCFIEDVKDLRAGYNYPAMYWGSVRYFRRIDLQLKKQENISLTQCIQSYQKKNRKTDKNFIGLLHSLDQDLKTPLFQNLLERCQQKAFSVAFD